MIVKINTWKAPNFRKLINYINDDKRRDSHALPVYHNILDCSIAGAIKDFYAQDKFRKKRSGGVAVYHEILSFHKDDKSLLSFDMLYDIARKYIDLRGKNSLCFAKPHIHNDNIHIHFAFSASELCSDISLRLDNKAFRRLKLEIEGYQVSKYPQLRNSVVYLSKRQQALKISDKEYRLRKKNDFPLDKDFVLNQFNIAFRNSSSFLGFCSRLDSIDGLSLYYYRDKFNGVIYKNKKYRFSSLGFNQERFEIREKKLFELTNINMLLDIKKQEVSLRNVIRDSSFLTRTDLNDNIRNISPFAQSKKKELLIISSQRKSLKGKGRFM